MEKIIKMIIWSLIVFSTINFTNASEWYIEKLLQINSWVEAFDIELAEIDYYSFTDKQLQNTYEEFIRTANLLKNEIIRKYENREFSYYQTKWIITNYKKFVYFTNQIFYYLSLREQWYTWKDIDYAVIETYKKIRTYYRRLKRLVYRKY